MSNFSVKIEGLEKMQAKLAKTPLAWKPLLEKAAEFADGEAANYLANRPGATGQLAMATKYKLAPGAIPLQARVYHATPISLDVERGRPAGRPQPPIDAMERWIRRAGINRSGFYLARQIKQYGTKGIFFMKKAAEATEKKIPEFVREAAASIEKMWGR